MSKMSVYFVHGMSSVIDVEADSVEEAIAKATALTNFRPCHQCNDSFEPDGEMEVQYVYGPDGNVVLDADAEELVARRTAAGTAAARVRTYLAELDRRIKSGANTNPELIQSFGLDGDAARLLVSDLRSLLAAAEGGSR
ncbi:hypothetical protein [Amycolatopsis sp. PS_44_ISF1]|uniref:hypothetical protein n=1 Tax=Amycolatopsis sp. PS_44_ISF1 TaxID=2974917 RepID=UPI0028DE78CD|nr:hypothetical protein [Amycolatopsis sp. PS_44_ISF1]MDT8915816.1 hypothetical protein [Amycolatopsis sp. PS_44_ISF1]